MKWLVGILILVTVASAVYLSILLSPPTSPGFNFFTSSSSPVTLPEAPDAEKPVTATTPPAKPATGYSIQIHGATETITSVAAGASIDAPVNSAVSQERSVLSVRPPEATQGETIRLQKSTDSYGNTAMQIPSIVNGLQTGFDALRSAGDNREFNPANVAGPAHVHKMRNLTVSGYPAVQVHITTTAGSTGGAQDFYLTWVRSGSTNWYITRTAEGHTAAAKTALDIMFNSIVLTR